MIDKLALVGSSRGRIQAVIELWHAAAAAVQPPSAQEPRAIEPPKAYEHAAAAPFLGMSMYWGPLFRNTPAVRFECNPSRFDDGITSDVGRETVALMGLKTGKVTRVDVAVDYDGIQAREVHAGLLKARKRSSWCNGDEGDGFHVGSRSSETMLRGYDRRTPQRTFRLEAAVKPGRGGRTILLPDLERLPDPFDTAELWTAANAVPIGVSSLVSAFLSRAREIGISRVIDEMAGDASSACLVPELLATLERPAFRVLDHPSMAFTADFVGAARAAVELLSSPERPSHFMTAGDCR